MNSCCFGESRTRKCRTRLAGADRPCAAFAGSDSSKPGLGRFRYSAAATLNVGRLRTKRFRTAD
eukprot:1177275-Prorocentrum_minimum.AAC.2